jgi:Transmembrane protein 33/Nucleoporin POM33
MLIKVRVYTYVYVLGNIGKYTEAYNAYNSGLRLTGSGDKAVLQEKSEQAMAAIRAASDREERARQSASSSYGASGASYGGSAPSAVSPPGILGVVHKYSKMSVFVSAVLYLVPLSVTRFSYRIFGISALVSILITLFTKHGMPKFNMQYGAAVLMNPIAMYAVLAILLLFTKPYLIAMLPIVFTELTSYTDYIASEGRKNLPMIQDQLGPMIAKYAPAMAGGANPAQALGQLFSPQGVSRMNFSLLGLAATCEVVQGIYLVFELISPSRSVFITMLWWQYLQMRYMVDQGPHLKSAFKNIDTRISGLLSHRMVPGAVRSGYTLLKSYLAKQVQLPTADGAARPSGLMGGLSSALGKCTIM